MSVRPNRRELFLAALGIAALQSGRVASGGVAAPDGGGGDVLEEAPLEALATLGRAWLAGHPGMTEERLRAEVEAEVGTWSPEAGFPQDRIASAIEREFADGATVTIGGWTVARTTARLGALVALATEGER